MIDMNMYSRKSAQAYGNSNFYICSSLRKCIGGVVQARDERERERPVRLGDTDRSQRHALRSLVAASPQSLYAHPRPEAGREKRTRTGVADYDETSGQANVLGCGWWQRNWRLQVSGAPVALTPVLRSVGDLEGSSPRAQSAADRRPGNTGP